MVAPRNFTSPVRNRPAASSLIHNWYFCVHLTWIPLFQTVSFVSFYHYGGHLSPFISVGVESASCEACSEPGDVRGQLFCTNCDKHYHAECLMLESNRVVRAGWRCPDCKICQTCRQAGDDAEMIMCNVCDKGYHTFCLRNQSIPKDGWSCSSCLSLTKKNSSTKSMCSLCQNEISSKQNTRQCHLCQIRIHATCHSVTDDYYDDDSTYICRSCSVSSSTITLPMDEGDEDDELQKEIYRSSSTSKVNRFVSTSQKSSNSPAASPSSGISTRKRRSMDYSQQSSLEYTPGGGDSSEMNTPAASNNQQGAPFLFESLSSIKDESSEHSMDLPMASTINMSTIKQEEEDQPNLAQSSRSVRTAVGQKSGKGKPACEISKKRARRVCCFARSFETNHHCVFISLPQALNNGHRRASSPQSSSTSAQLSAANQARNNAAVASASLRGRPPKVRKDMPAQSAVGAFVEDLLRTRHSFSLNLSLERRRNTDSAYACLEHEHWQYGQYLCGWSSEARR